jgi:hypothetical protein
MTRDYPGHVQVDEWSRSMQTNDATRLHWVGAAGDMKTFS